MFPKKLLKTEMPFSILFQNRIGGGRFLISTFYFFWELVKTNLSLCTFKKILSSITTTIVIFYIFLNSRNCRIDAKRIPGNPAQAFKTDVLRVERLLCEIRSKLWPIVFYVISIQLILFEDNVLHFNENNEVSSSEQLNTYSYDTVKG